MTKPVTHLVLYFIAWVPHTKCGKWADQNVTAYPDEVTCKGCSK